MTIKAVIWDLGGVLLRTIDGSGREHWAKRIGITRQELEEIVFSSKASLLAQSGEISDVEHWEFVGQKLGLPPDELVDFESDFWNGDRLDMDLIEFIQGLHPRYKTGLLSNNFHWLRSAIAKDWKIEASFDSIIISSEVHLLKPDPRIFWLAVTQLNISPEEAIFIDDYPENLFGAEKIGMQAMQFYNPEQIRNDLVKILNAQDEQGKPQ